MDYVHLIKTKNGFMMIELLVAASIILCLVAMAAASHVINRQDLYVEFLTREAIMDLQWVQQSSHGNSLNRMDDWCMSIRKEEYLILHNNYEIKKRKKFSRFAYIQNDNIKEIRFDAMGRPKGENMKFIICSKNGKTTKTVIIAASTGRIRVE